MKIIHVNSHSLMLRESFIEIKLARDDFLNPDIVSSVADDNSE